jgi:site-specific recombinase XerD
MTDEGVRGILACVANELMIGYREHLLLDRNLSENSIRAYTADLQSLLEHINKLGITEFKDLTIDHLAIITFSSSRFH